MITAEQIIEHYKLEPLDQEGGFFRQIWRSPMRVQNSSLEGKYPAAGDHPMGTVIHFLLTSDSFSAMHRLPTAEHWFYHFGDGAEMLLLHANGSADHFYLGADLEKGEQFQITTPSDSWQGTRLCEGGIHGFMFGSCVMVPGFEWTDFELGEREALCQQYPKQSHEIKLRTRNDVFKGKQ